VCLQDFLLAQNEDGLLTGTVEIAASHRFQVTLAQVHEAALRLGILPARYSRNREMISIAQQLHLCQSKVAVVGCGGLGGYVIEELARLGVGQLVAIDYDSFEEHNLNRQLLSTSVTLGQSKVEAAVQRVSIVNGAVRVIAQKKAFSAENAEKLLEGAAVVVDALDTVPIRLTLSESCGKLNIPMVHGAISGWYGQLTTQFPGDGPVERIYSGVTNEKGMETIMGNPSFTPAIVASMQAAEVCKVLLGEGTPLRRRIIFINLLSMEFIEMRI
jgi:molybdopterin/thiamine biosynthesis adenylyltransferase